MTVIAATDTELVHEVRLLHASTGQTLPLDAPRLLFAPHGWSLRAVDGRVVVVAPTGQPAPGTVPAIDVVVADGVLADLLALPALQPGQRPRSVRRSLTAAVIDVPLAPVPMTLTIVLTKTDGAPSAGRTVKVKGSSGPDIALPETTTPGTYRSAATVWDARYTPAALMIAGSLTGRKVGVTFRSTATTVHVADTV